MKKKIAVVFASLLAVVMMAVSLAACGVSGTYKLEEMSVTVNGQVLTAKAGEELVYEEKIGETTSINRVAIDEKTCVFTFKSNGTYSISMYLPVFFENGVRTMDVHEEGTWEEKDGKINVENKDGETKSITVDGKKIILDLDIYKIVLKK